MEHSFKPWRRKLWTCAQGNILEVGVGTSKNFPYYPRAARVVGIDLAGQMLARARQHDVTVELAEGDVQQLEFSDNTFDTAIATFVFCSVSDPVCDLRELNRVVKSNGRILFLEHVRIDQSIMGRKHQSAYA